MNTIFEIGTDGLWTGVSLDIEEADGAPAGWTRTVPPAAGEGQFVLWAGGVWTVLDQAPRPVLPDLPLKKFRRALIEAGLFAGVEAAIEALPEPDRALARNEFEYSVNIVRTDPWVTALAPALGLTDAEIDTLWTWAAGL